MVDLDHVFGSPLSSETPYGSVRIGKMPNVILTWIAIVIIDPIWVGGNKSNALGDLRGMPYLQEE